MIVSNCPRCHETFRIPSGPIPEDAQAICPWCQEQFPLAEVIDELPPVLGLVSASGSPIEVDDSRDSGFISDADPYSSHLATSETMSDEEIFDNLNVNGDPGSATVTEDTVTEEDDWNLDGVGASNDVGAMGGPASSNEELAPMRVMPVPVRRRKKGAGIRTAIGVVLGGFAAVPIAGGLLMLMGRTPDWGFWPFDGGNSEPSSNVVAAPTGSLGPQEFPRPSRPFGQSLAAPDNNSLQDQTDPRDSALDQILGDDNDDSSTELNDEEEPLLGFPETDTTDDVELNDDDLDAMLVPDPFPVDVDSLPAEITAVETTPSGEDLLTEESSTITLPDSLAVDPLGTEDAMPQLDPDELVLPVDDEDASVVSLLGNRDPFAPEEPTETTAPRETEQPQETEDVEVAIADPDEAATMIELPELDAPRDPINIDIAPSEEIVDADVTAEQRADSADVDMEDVPPRDAAPAEATIESVASDEVATPPTSAAEDDASMALEAPETTTNVLRDSPKVLAAAQAAEKLVDQLDTFDGSSTEKRNLLRKTYLQVAEACNDAPASSEAMEALATRIANSSVIDDIEEAGLDWIRFSRRHVDGVALVGRTDSADGTTLSLRNGKSIRLENAGTLPQSAKVVTLGRILDDASVEVVAAKPVE